MYYGELDDCHTSSGFSSGVARHELPGDVVHGHAHRRILLAHINTILRRHHSVRALADRVVETAPLATPLPLPIHAILVALLDIDTPCIRIPSVSARLDVESKYPALAFAPKISKGVLYQVIHTVHASSI